MNLVNRIFLLVLVMAVLAGLPVAMASEKNRGKAELSFNGGIEEHFSGEATYMVQELESGKMFILVLYAYESEINYTAISLVLYGGVPETGTFDLGNEPGDADFHVGIVQMN